MTNQVKKLREIATGLMTPDYSQSDYVAISLNREIADELNQIADEWEREHEDDDQLAEQEMQLANERDTLRQENERLKAELEQAHRKGASNG